MEDKTSFFDQMSEQWDTICHHDGAKLRYLLNRISMRSGDDVLDVGTGTGVLIPYIRELNREGTIHAVDRSAKMIEVAWRKFGNDQHLDFQVANVESEDIPGHYHQILLYSVFPHLENREKTVLRLVSNNLNSGGVLLIAHSQSRKALNQVHRMRDNRVSKDLLIDVETQKQKLMQEGLHVLEAVENEDFYYLIITKK